MYVSLVTYSFLWRVVEHKISSVCRINIIKDIHAEVCHVATTFSKLYSYCNKPSSVNLVCYIKLLLTHSWSCDIVTNFCEYVSNIMLHVHISYTLWCTTTHTHIILLHIVVHQTCGHHVYQSSELPILSHNTLPAPNTITVELQFTLTLNSSFLDL